MATATMAPAENQGGFVSWFWDFLKGELAPYPGRGVMVARIVIAATITMILTMTFRVPGGALGGIIAFLISRENIVATTKFTVSIATAVLMATIFVPVGTPTVKIELPVITNNRLSYEGINKASPVCSDEEQRLLNDVCYAAPSRASLQRSIEPSCA